MSKTYLCIDLKSFYASVECVERGLDPFQVKLVVADPARGPGAITLAATPAIKACGVKSRGRVFEIPEGLEYITAPPRMSLYMRYAANIYGILLKYIAKEDIHVYSIDESFLDITPYLALYGKDARQLAKQLLADIYETTGITASVGIGTNLYLAKVALDIMAKHAPDHIAYLDELLYCHQLWRYQPLTDFWMIGEGTLKRLAQLGISDMYGVAHTKPSVLYQRFGVNAEYLIDHAWGKEPAEIRDIKAYQPAHASISHSQILMEDYDYENACLVMKEMVDAGALTLTDRKLVTNRIALSIGYSKDMLPPVKGSRKITNTTNTCRILQKEFSLLYHRLAKPNVPIRQIAVHFCDVKPMPLEQYDLFTDLKQIQKEKDLQEALVAIRCKYGKNAVLKGMNYLEKATARKRNQLIGGHHA